MTRGAALALKDDAGMTAMHYAAREGHSEAVAELVRSGAPVNATDREGWTPLHDAAFNGQTATVRVLINAQAALDRATASARRLTSC